MTPGSAMTLRNGVEMPVLGLGTWLLTRDTAGAVETALELGYRMIDTSGDYGTQPGVGEGFRRSGLPREEVFISTKIEEDDEAYSATERNLSELQLEAADLVLIHRPPSKGAGEELWEGLIHARENGLTRAIGVSNYSADLIETLVDATGETPAVNQIEWTPFGYSDAMARFCDERRIAIQAYSPLTHGKRLDDPTLGEIARACSVSPAQVLIRWGLQRGVAPLPKANQRRHMEENIDVFGFTLSEADMTRLNALNTKSSSLGVLAYD